MNRHFERGREVTKVSTTLDLTKLLIKNRSSKKEP